MRFEQFYLTLKSVLLIDLHLEFIEFAVEKAGSRARAAPKIPEFSNNPSKCQFKKLNLN